METKKRGRPRKVKLPEEVLTLVEDTKKKVEESIEKSEIKPEVNQEWDYPKDSKIEFFDITKSYELTGYKPITKTQGLNFDPNWFTETREVFLRTGHYCLYRPNTKAYAEFWDEQYKRCRNGYTANGYTITGDNYFFLNFFLLMDLDNTERAGGGRLFIFPAFYNGQYEIFHYIELCRKLRLNACIMKSREIGYSEMLSAIASNSYNSIRNTVNLITAFTLDYLTTTLGKVWNCLSFINDHTDGGFFKLRQVIDKADHKKASVLKMVEGQKVETGWMSLIIGIIADKPNKIRGYRADLLVFEEAGSFRGLAKAYVQSTALVGNPGSAWGLRLVGGTSGDTKEALEGLKDMFYDPKAFGILPFKHKYTLTGEEALTSYFVPCTKIPKDRKRFLDSRGFVDEDKVKEWQNEVRATMVNTPSALMNHCAEFPFNDTEAFSSGVINKFNKVYITELITRIRALKECPNIDIGYLEYKFKNGEHVEENIEGFKWIPNINSKLKILEHPLWNLSQVVDSEGKVIWSPPSEKIRDLYVIGIDGIDIGAALTSEATKDPSDFALVVLKRAYGIEEPKIVAIYKDRPQDPRESYKIALKLALYYNAKINVEATRMTIVSWAKQMKLIKWFMRRPRATLNESYRNTNKLYGTPATIAIIEHLTDLIADFITDYYENIWFDELLEELNNYSIENKRKFDLVAAFGMAMLADEELLGIVPKKLETQIDSWLDIGYYTDDNGVRHYGAIPKLSNLILWNNNFGLLYDDNRIRTSNTRLLSGYLS